MNRDVTLKFRIKVLVLFCFAFAIGYGGTNRFPVFTPQFLPYSIVDHWMGFRPWTIWFYVSDYLLIFLPVILIHNIHTMKRLIKAFFVNFAIHFPIFFFFPTTLERGFYAGEGLTGFAFKFIWFVDDAVNCFPSQHVSLCFVVSTAFWNYDRKLSILFFVWSTLISISTMTTKQHYFWDVLGGLAVAFICYWTVFRKKDDPKIQLVDPAKHS